MELIFAFIAGGAVVAGYVIWRSMKSGASLSDSVWFVKSGPGPWRPPK